MDVPQGTIAEVLDWVGGDPARALAALDAEYDGANRSTLTAQLQTIIEEEPTMSDPVAAEVEEVPAPEVPEVTVDPEDAGTTVLGAVVANSEVEAEIEIPLNPEPVESINGAVAPHGFVLVLNGQGYAFSPELAASLKGVVDGAVIGLTL